MYVWMYVIKSNQKIQWIDCCHSPSSVQNHWTTLFTKDGRIESEVSCVLFLHIHKYIIERGLLQFTDSMERILISSMKFK